MEMKIRCPHCGAVLKVLAKSGIENKTITCPACKESSLFKNYKQIIQNEEETKVHYKNDEKTQYASDKVSAIGCLRIKGSSGKSYPLVKGKNLVGRKADSSSARIQLIADNHMSREHLLIEVMEVEGQGLVHYLSLAKEAVNPTWINNERLLFGDSVILEPGAEIKMPSSVTLVFDMVDKDSTIY